MVLVPCASPQYVLSVFEVGYLYTLEDVVWTKIIIKGQLLKQKGHDCPGSLT